MLCSLVKNEDLLKKKEAKWFLSNMRLKAPLSKIPIVADVFF